MAGYDFDLFTLGAGSGGVAASRRAGSSGAKVAICEEGRVGGTCVLRGCVPKKLLVYAAHYRYDFEDAAGYGWTAGGPALDWKKLQAVKAKELDRLTGIYGRLLRDAGVTLVEGRGRVVDAHTVEVAGKRYTAERILVATGGRPYLPEVTGIEHALTSEQALELPALPRRVAVVGGGYIGVEFAGIFTALGAKVTMLIRGDTVLRGFDNDIRAALTQEMRKKGVDIRPETFVQDIEKREDGTLSLLTRMGETLEVDAVLYSTGRVPNTQGLGLEEAGVKLNERGAVMVDAQSRSSVESIYAVGDVTDRLNLTPVAIAEGRAMVETLYRNNPVTMDHENVPSAVFSQPPVGTVGLTEREAMERYGKVDVYVSSFRPMKHTLTGRDERSMMKVVVERGTERVLGFHMVGADAPEIIQGLAVALKCGVTKKQLDATVGIHPTAAEEFVTLRDKRPDPSESATILELGREVVATPPGDTRK
ncbi:glutathione-disulfide reductase [Corallococcus interemptor]|uniref:Glutathione reductase n=1 Tax=Corallococcus interemptor TaxID=2316720 RepID=A0A3A8QM59_9BACT|nr:glutathione-disulfide reductase [Corallococcus interemptor]RKH69846.1 glutathione-disulfide reductase [Corallococcus interemptor]